MLLAEVVPLAAYGQVIGGELDGLKVISKGGMAGDELATMKCIQFLQEHSD